MIYIHIPFCKQKCSYCNFHFSTSLKMKDDMITAMKKEIFLRKEELENKNLTSLYFGGGTPSILDIKDIEVLLDEVAKYFHFSENIEITLEANPDDLDQDFLKKLRNTSINRLSIGIQSFLEEDLRLMNRAHNSEDAQNCVKNAQDLGFDNINIDLIYGIPTSNFEQWQRNLDIAVDMDIQHISSYALTIEPKTALNQWIKKNPNFSPNETVQSRDFFYMVEFLQQNDFEHYEISNFGKKNYHSRHNSSYWEYAPYLGIGPSAHSYNGKDERSWNIANNAKYIKALSEDKLPKEAELLSIEDKYNEMLMIGLRTSKGINIQKLEQSFPNNIIEKFYRDIKYKLSDSVLILEGNYLKINKSHWFLADGIASDLFLI